MRRSIDNVPKGYDSWLEWDLAKVLTKCKYHPCTVPYVQHKNYHPDFLIKRHGITYYIEAKGRFREAQEARKYIDVRDSLKPQEELVFIFQNPNNKMPNAKLRRDGTKRTMREWADDHKFVWYTPDTLPEEWL